MGLSGEAVPHRYCGIILCSNCPLGYSTLFCDLFSIEPFAPVSLIPLVIIRNISVASASLTWIAAVVLGVLLLIVVVALTIWLFTRDRGETYKLYEKERAHGNDPIQEIKETEGFKTYQRQEEQPIASSRYSLNDGSLHVGSDEDGELEEYDKDYNEQGSFIHDYAADPALSRPIFDSPSLEISANGPRRPGQSHPVV
ncbi:unnamed protein product [Dicrocoelium dendriticum]|nr:unnamed protein product [Dicrocoelium dendriticum]